MSQGRGFVVGVDVAQLNLHRMESDDLDVCALIWCGGWDSNPRTPTGQGPEPCAFDLAWQYERHHNTRDAFPRIHYYQAIPRKMTRVAMEGEDLEQSPIQTPSMARNFTKPHSSGMLLQRWSEYSL